MVHHYSRLAPAIGLISPEKSPVLESRRVRNSAALTEGRRYDPETRPRPTFERIALNLQGAVRSVRIGPGWRPLALTLCEDAVYREDCLSLNSFQQRMQQKYGFHLSPPRWQRNSARQYY